MWIPTSEKTKVTKNGVLLLTIWPMAGDWRLEDKIEKMFFVASPIQMWIVQIWHEEQKWTR